jgi:hypothetical protein
MNFIDTNIFLYAVGEEHPLRKPCQDILRMIGDGALTATSNCEVVQELLYVLSRRGKLQEGIHLARSILAIFPDLLPVSVKEISLACDLLSKNPGLSVRDAVHAATMMTCGIRTIISSDRHFDSLPEIHRIDPEDLAKKKDI